MPCLVQCGGEKLVAEAATVSVAIQGAEGRIRRPQRRQNYNPSGQPFSVSEYKVIVAGVRVESERCPARTPCRCRRQRRRRHAHRGDAADAQSLPWSLQSLLNPMADEAVNLPSVR